MTSPGDALKAALEGLAPEARVGVAVSGGGDSVALLVLAAELLGPARVCAATVDHGLRPEAAAEAAQVAALCSRLGVAHDLLLWRSQPGPGNLMAQARAARQALLADWAHRARLPAVLLGHTQDDQAETVLMRLARGSGVDGLSAMAPVRRMAGVLWLRPLLPVSRAALRAVLEARRIGWSEDPTNDDPRFGRTRARAALSAVAALGLTAGGLAATATRMAQARAALEFWQRDLLARLMTEHLGTAVLDSAALDLPGEMRGRLLSGLIRGLAGAAYRPRRAALDRVLAALEREGGAATLSGVCLRRAGGRILMWREAAAVAGLRVPAGAVWDRRWQACGPEPDGAEIAALGQAGLDMLSRQARARLHPHWRETGLSRAALAGLPAIWRADRLVAAPLALWPQGWSLSARPLAAPGIDAVEFD